LIKKSFKRVYAKPKEVFFLDIIQSEDIQIYNSQSQNIDLLEINKTVNSLYNLENPKVFYFVNQDNTLIRTEGYNYQLPIDFQNYLQSKV